MTEQQRYSEARHLPGGTDENHGRSQESGYLRTSNLNINSE
jgi:hypothetical protein